jgi:hypothetical protein
MCIPDGNDDDHDTDDDSLDIKAFYALLADLSPEDWEDGAAYGLPQ